MKGDKSSRTPKRAELSRRNILEAGRLLQPVNVRSRVLTAILILLSLYILKIGSAFFVPIVLAFLLGALFAPVVRGLSRLWILRPVGAAIVLIVVLGTVSYAGYKLSGPATAWVAKAPESLEQIELKLRGVKKSVEDVSKTRQQVDKITSFGTEEKAQKVEVKKPGLGSLF